MLLIDKLHSMAEVAVEGLQWPFRRRMIERAAAAKVDAVESMKLETETKIVNLRKKLTTITKEDEAGQVLKEILQERVRFEEAEALARLASEEVKMLFSDFVEDEAASTPTEKKNGKK